MIFVGDIAIPFCNLMKLQNFPEDFSSKNLFGNLEGEIIDNSLIDLKKTRAVFNDRKTIADLVSEFNFIGFALANNHITDLTGHQFTINYLNEINVPFCGIGENIIDASKPLMLIDGEIEVVILNFGWEIIQCEVATNKSPGVNPLQKNHVVTVLCDTVAKYPKAKIIPYMHWSYELEAEPQPFERELAKKMIDLGAAGVIGSHPHRVGGFELYKNKPIVYSLGNWMFKQNYYFDGKLAFPDFCNLELAFEWDFMENKFIFHFFEYDRKESTLTYLRTEDENSPTMLKHTPFLNLSNEEYKSWYRANHYHKNKGLPIYYWEDRPWQINMKNRWNSTRNRLIKVLLNKGK